MIRFFFLSLIVLSITSKVVSASESETTLLSLVAKNYNPARYAPVIFSQPSITTSLIDEDKESIKIKLTPLQYTSLTFLSCFCISGAGLLFSAIFDNTTALSFFGGIFLCASARGITDAIYHRDRIPHIPILTYAINKPL